MKAFVIFATALIPAQMFAADLVGSVVPPYPEGLLSKQGICVARGVDYDHICDYAFGILEDTQGKLLMVLGKKSVSGPDESPLWLVTDAMAYPALPDDYYLAMGVCQINEKADDTIIAAVQVVDAEWFNNVMWARRLDIETGKFVDISSAGIQCVNEGWGV